MYVFLTVVFFILHTLIVLILVKKRLKKQDDKWNGVIIWLGWISIFLPLIGEFGYLTFWFLSHNSINHFDSSGEDSTSTDTFHPPPSMRTADIPTESIELMLEKDDNVAKREIIMVLLDHNIPNVNRYLEKLLDDDDPEIVHYAATTINTLHRRFRETINAHTKDECHEDLSNYEQSIAAYENYLKSGLLESTLKSHILKEYTDYLEKTLTQQQEQPQLLNKLGWALQELKKREDAHEVFVKLIKNYPNYYGGYCGLINHYYINGDWDNLKQLIMKVNKYVKKESIPNSYRQILIRIGGNL
ncbi:tetratricopeptide repeat protein [Halobacillus litoralis]|uniref:tetratricopeptide repeat protein n=1 Tax=Halobacillus litoralis TaxID=45668 RepID=UPI001CFE893B|nr:tetratricopeptide repeat protein [Halobacillus litoralis]